ncbi:hypothetical protein J6590_075024 [Homalodisca vitripennis]|nr:hypothetical protein J6590_075024 [Homalodisca vitripennis]
MGVSISARSMRGCPQGNVLSSLRRNLVVDDLLVSLNRGTVLDCSLNLSPLDIVIRVMSWKSAYYLQQVGLWSASGCSRGHCRVSILIQGNAQHMTSDQMPQDIPSTNPSGLSILLGRLGWRERNLFHQQSLNGLQTNKKQKVAQALQL